MKRKFKWLIALAVLVGLIIAAVRLLDDTTINGRLAHHPVYRATTRFQVSFGSTLPQSEFDVWPDIQQYLEHMIHGPSASEQAIADLGLARGLPRTEDDDLTTDGELTAEGRRMYKKLLDDISGSVMVTREVDHADVQIFAVSVVHEEPEMAAKLANRMTQNFIRRSKKSIQAKLIEQKRFFELQVDRWRHKVSVAESAMLRFVLNNKGEIPDDPLRAHDRLHELKAERNATQDEMYALKSELKAMVEHHDALPDVIKQRVVLENTHLNELKEQRRALLDLYLAQLDETDRPPDDPAMLELRNRIDQTGKQIKSLAGEPQFREIEQPNVEKQQLAEQIAKRRDNVEACVESLEWIKDEIEKYTVINRNFFAVRNEYQRLERELADARKKLAFWDEHLRRVTVAATIEFSAKGLTMSVIERASPDMDPMTLDERQAWNRAKQEAAAPTRDERMGLDLPWHRDQDESESDDDDDMQLSF